MRHKLTQEKAVIYNGGFIVPPQRMRSEVIKNVLGDIHCGITTTQKRLKLEAWWPGYPRDMEQYIKKMPEMYKDKRFSTKNKHSWPTEKEPWKRVHMDHANISEIGL